MRINDHLIIKKRYKLFVSLFVCTLFLWNCQSYSIISKTYEGGYSDLHNSSLFRLFYHNTIDGLEDEKQPVTWKGIEQAKAKTLVMSIGIPKFDDRFFGKTTIEDILTFLDQFSTYYQQKKVPHKPNIVFALEGSWLLNGQLSWLDSLKNRGVVMVGLAHRFENSLFNVPPQDRPSMKGPVFLTDSTPLSITGKKAVQKLITLGIQIDMSHMPTKAFWEIIKMNNNQRPLYASHSNSKSYCNISRNLDDSQIKAIAFSGGLIGVCFHQPLLCIDQKEGQENLESLINQITYLIKIAGEDHVAIGSDLEGLITPIQGLERIENVHKIADELFKKGYSSQTIEKIMWKNIHNHFKR